MAFTALAFSGNPGFTASRGTRTAPLFGLRANGGLIEVLQVFVPGRSSE
jgi:VanZ family protein